ncbi:MAG TPA: NAD(P)-binding protein, partial [Blastocatellia bacterium]|nr:NAD(P)-binding protein [Blastocatellia bacterium]
NQAVALIIFIFVITSTTSTYMIKYNYSLSKLLGRALGKVGMKDIDAKSEEDDSVDVGHKPIVFLGFYREASAIVHEFELKDAEGERHSMLDEMLVIDFNPVVFSELRKRGIGCLYGDISHMETLHHAHIHEAQLVISTIPDNILKGTDNERLLRKIRQLCPHARAIVTADSPQRALQLYERGADFVFIPRLHSSAQMAGVIESGFQEGFERLRNEQIEHLKLRKEVLS